MDNSTRGARLGVGAFVVTIGVACCIAIVAIAILTMEAHNCKFMGQALVALWVTIAAVFLASVVVVGVVAWRIIAEAGKRLGLMVVYGVALLVSYVVIAFGLMVLFNC